MTDDTMWNNRIEKKQWFCFVWTKTQNKYASKQQPTTTSNNGQQQNRHTSVIDGVLYTVGTYMASVVFTRRVNKVNEVGRSLT